MQLPSNSLTSQVGILDFLLAEVVESLQLNGSQIARVESAYRSIGTWLSQPDSSLAPFLPGVYPQGSVALGTTVRPLLRDAFDLDFVVELTAGFPGTPMELYELLLKRLEQHGTYAPMLERKRRCIRLQYAGDFYVDVLGARAVASPNAPGSIEVPDRKTPAVWRASNPRGFATWFHNRAQLATRERFLADAAPLPSDWSANSKTTLQRIVQLTKRARDVAFRDGDAAPRSIVLTTLLAHAYRGRLSVYEALTEALAEIATMIARAQPRRLVVLNPTNPAEDFSERWDKDRKSYTAFVHEISRLGTELHELRHHSGLNNIATALGHLFGRDNAGQAVHRYQIAFKEARQTGQLRSTGPAIIMNSTAGRVIPRNRNYGGVS